MHRMSNLGNSNKPLGDPTSAGSVDVTSSLADVDDALRFLKAGGQNGDFNSVDERRLLRKIDWYIMPMLFGVYFLQYTDKSLRK